MKGYEVSGGSIAMFSLYLIGWEMSLVLFRALSLKSLFDQTPLTTVGNIVMKMNDSIALRLPRLSHFGIMM